MIAVLLEHFCSRQTSKHIHIVKERSSKQTNRRYTHSPCASAVRLIQHAGIRKGGGARRDRTDDLLLAKQALSQLSYGPVALPETVGGPADLVGLGRFELPTSPLSGVRSNQLSYRPGISTRAHPQRVARQVCIRRQVICCGDSRTGQLSHINSD